MVIAGEPSGDELAAQLVTALQAHRASLNLPPAHVFGAGGTQLKAAGADISIDLTQHAVIGLWEVLRRYSTFRRVFHQLLDLAGTEQPDVFVGVDFGGFNLRFARALRERARSIARGLPEPSATDASRMPQAPWNPRIVQFVSPQVWASRPGRAQLLESTHDLLLSILPSGPAFHTDSAGCRYCGMGGTEACTVSMDYVPHRRTIRNPWHSRHRSRLHRYGDARMRMASGSDARVLQDIMAHL
jgi:lipid A disaccharide synthetase